MHRSNLIDNIADHAAYFAWKVDGRMAAVHYDINIDAEQSLIPVLNAVFDVELVNANKLRANFPAVDLVDVRKKVAFQITGSPTLDKILETIRKFIDYKLYEQFQTLYIYILTKKKDSYDATKINMATRGKFHFDTRANIVDFKDVISRTRLIQSIDILATIEQGYRQLTAFLEPQWKKSANQGAGPLPYLDNLIYRLESIIGNKNIDKIPKLSHQLKKIGFLQEKVLEKEKEINTFRQAFEQNMHNKGLIEVLNAAFVKLKNEYVQLKEDLEKEKTLTDILTTYIKEQKKLLDQDGRQQTSERMQRAKILFDAGEHESVDELLNYEGREEFINKKLAEKREQTAELLELADEEVFLALSILQKEDWDGNIQKIKAHFERSIELGGYGNNAYVYSIFLENNGENELSLDILRITLANIPKDQALERAQIFSKMGNLLLSDSEEEALRAHMAAADIYTSVYDEDSPKYGLELAENLFYCGSLTRERAALESRIYLERALSILTRLNMDEEDGIKAMKLKFFTLIYLGYMDQQEGNSDYARMYFQDAMQVGATLTFNDPVENISYLLDAVGHFRSLSEQDKDTEHTSLLYKLALGSFLIFRNQETMKENHAHAILLIRVGLRLLAAEETRGADICFRNGLKIFRILLRRGYSCLSDISEGLSLVSIKFKLLNDSKRVERCLHEAVEIRRQLVEEDPKNNLSNLASLLTELYIQSFVGRARSEFSRSGPYFDEALSIYKRLNLTYGDENIQGWVELLRTRSMFISRGIDQADAIDCYHELNYLKNRMTPQQIMSREEDIHAITNELSEPLLKNIDLSHPFFMQIITDILLAGDYFLKTDPENYKMPLIMSLFAIAEIFSAKDLWKEAFPYFQRSIALVREFPELDKKFTVSTMFRLAQQYYKIQDYLNAAYWFVEQCKYFENRMAEHPDEASILVSSMFFAAEMYLLDGQVEIASEYIAKGRIQLSLVLEPTSKAEFEERFEVLNQKLLRL